MNRLFRLGLGIVFIFILQGHALGAEALRVGIVDVSRLQNTSKNFQKTKAILKKKLDGMQKKLDQEKGALAKIEDEFRKQSMMLSLDAKEGKTRELKKKRRYLKYLFDDYSQQMKDAEMEVVREFGKELKEVVKKVAEKKGFLFVFEKNTPGLLAYDDIIDITDSVTKEYDRLKRD